MPLSGKLLQANERDGHPMETITKNLFSFDLMSQYGADFVLGLSMQVIAGILTIFIGFWLSGRASRLVIKAFSKICLI